MTIRLEKGFSLMEVLIVGTLIALIGATVPLTVNFKTQILKSQDARRKGDLSTLKKVLEDFYNDKNRYASPDEICYESSPPNPCNICGYRKTPAEFSPYLGKLPCDPQHPAKDYLYQVDNTTSPTWYRIYAKLSNNDDAAINEVGCQYGCGPPPNYEYTYGVSSSNIDLEKNTNFCSGFPSLYTITQTGCDNCGNYEKCKSSYPSQTYYIYPSCRTPCIKD